MNSQLNDQHSMISEKLRHCDIIKCVFLCAYMLSSEVGGKLDYSPVSWREYYDQMEDVNVGPADSTDIFRIYKAGSDGPLLVLLHGGGHSALSWAVFTVSINATTSVNKGNQITFLFCFRQPFPVGWPAEYSPWISGVMVSGQVIHNRLLIKQGPKHFTPSLYRTTAFRPDVWGKKCCCYKS